MNTSRYLAAAAAIGMVAVASSADAQNTATGTGTANVQILKALSVTGHNDLQFGKVAISATAGGSVAISESGTRSVSGGAALVGGASVTPANFVFNGEPSATVTVNYSDAGGANNASGAYTLNSGSNSAALTITSTKQGSQTLDSSGNLTVPIAGTVALNAAQAGGTYTGNYYVTVAYN